MNNFDEIESYLANRLSPAEKEALEARMATDSDLREQVQLHKLALEALRLQERKSLKVALQQHREQNPVEESLSQVYSRLLLWAAIFLGCAIILFTWFSKPDDNKPQIPSTTVPELRKDTIKPVSDTAKTNQENTVPKAKQHLDPKRIFAAYFKPFKSPDWNQQLRTEASESPFKIYLKYYLSSDYGAVANQFGSLDHNDKQNENIQFIQANALMATRQVEAALPILEHICSEKSSIYTTEAQWRLALAYLYVGDLKKAKSLLLFIKSAANGQLQHARDAEKLLETL